MSKNIIEIVAVFLIKIENIQMILIIMCVDMFLTTDGSLLLTFFFLLFLLFSNFYLITFFFDAAF